MAIQAYVIFNGNCREAVEFYSKVFNTSVQEILTFGDGQMDMAEEDKKLIMHTYLMISGSCVMFSDTFPGQPVTVGNNISLTVISKDIDEIRTQFNILKEGGRVDMDLQETFWSKCYGMVTDKFGVCWQLSHENG